MTREENEAYKIEKERRNEWGVHLQYSNITT